MGKFDGFISAQGGEFIGIQNQNYTNILFESGRLSYTHHLAPAASFEFQINTSTMHESSDAVCCFEHTCVKT